MKNSGDGTGEERMASQILVEYYMVYPIISSIFFWESHSRFYYILLK